MSSKSQPQTQISSTIKGPVSGQVAVGNHIQQMLERRQSSFPTQEDLESFHQSLIELKRRIASEAPDEKQAAALERAGELEEAVTAKKPDLSTMEYVKNWFLKNVPALAGAVTSVIVHPIVGKLVEAAGDALADDFKHRFGF